jgi:hypothetical protein
VRRAARRDASLHRNATQRSATPAAAHRPDGMAGSCWLPRSAPGATCGCPPRSMGLALVRWYLMRLFPTIDGAGASWDDHECKTARLARITPAAAAAASHLPPTTYSDVARTHQQQAMAMAKRSMRSGGAGTRLGVQGRIWCATLTSAASGRSR